jgi:hypothetical protein
MSGKGAVINDVPVSQVISLIAQDKDNELIARLVDNNVTDVKSGLNTISFALKSGVEVVIKSNYGDYNLYISDLSVYQQGDSPFKLYSFDRVKFYLEKLCSE